MRDLTNQSIGRYYILEKLGEGGMAIVYKAYDTRLESEVAVKFIRTDVFPPIMLERILERFKKEAKLMARLTHPNIVKVTDYGEFEGTPYLVMPYLSGGTLKNRMGSPVPWGEAVLTLLPIVDALGYAHDHHSIHRDVKPSNILITETGQPVLTDFGIAKILETEKRDEFTQTGAGVGTPEYMAPEQGVGKQIDKRVDIYSLGIVFYELITGVKPYVADTPMVILLKHMNDPLPRPKLFIPQLPIEVERVLLKATAKLPEDRYTSMAELKQALKKLLALPIEPVSIDTTQRSPDEVEVTIDGVLATEPGRKPIRLFEFFRENLFSWGVIGLFGFVFVSVFFLWLFIFSNTDSNDLQITVSPTTGSQITPLVVAATPEIIKTITQTIPPSETIIASPTERIITEQPTKPVEIRINPKDNSELVFIPAGEFIMGSDSETDPYFWGAEGPSHRVYLDGYWMYRYEVTNAMYQECVTAGACPRPQNFGSRTRTEYYDDPNYANYPVIYVTWVSAQAYCKWIGGRMPTEAEWEKAARGDIHTRLFPWGNTPATGEQANFCDLGCPGKIVDVDKRDGFRDTSPVGNYPLGVSPYGLMDMAGNVWEWVFDYFSPGYYQISPERNPQGPQSSRHRVIRGGAWNNISEGVRVVQRTDVNPEMSLDTVGFRCLVDAMEAD